MAAEIALVTERRYESPTDITPNVANILEEDRLLIEALGERGIAARRVDWSRDDVDWSGFAAVVLRTPWDYFDRFEAFSRWLDGLQSHPRVINDLEALRWNSDKHYLAELEAAGLPIVPTVFVERGEGRSLEDAARALGTEALVFKPTVSGAAFETYRVRPGTVGEYTARFSALTAERAMMVQPFMASVLERGEVTVVAMQGQPTHGLVKRAKAGDFRVQDDHGGTLHDHVATAEELAVARQAIAAAPHAPLYGRVDLVRDDSGQPTVMELELIEPELWFRRHPPAAAKLARALAARLRR